MWILYVTYLSQDMYGGSGFGDHSFFYDKKFEVTYQDILKIKEHIEKDNRIKGASITSWEWIPYGS
jgi:hypothetical protein